MLLFCPRTFVGKTIENGLRSAIARVAGVRHPQHVSSLTTLIRTWLEYDRAFREQVDALCETVISEIKEK
ncbi:MAG: hypothetical protein RRY73_02905 [Alistipes sp.]